MDDRDQIVLPRNYSVFHDIISIPPIYEALTVTLVKQPVFTLWIPANINGLTRVKERTH